MVGSLNNCSSKTAALVIWYCKTFCSKVTYRGSVKHWSKPSPQTFERGVGGCKDRARTKGSRREGTGNTAGHYKTLPRRCIPVPQEGQGDPARARLWVPLMVLRMVLQMLLPMVPLMLLWRRMNIIRIRICICIRIRVRVRVRIRIRCCLPGED